ncbi:RNA-directed DNA polymerase, eukaryota, reverse transcriptase zinc-binding domain protein [Tanacetum coccineum]
MRNREVVDDFISQKRDPTDAEMFKWNINMVAYYKQRNEELVNKGKASSVQSKQIIKVDDVFQDDSGKWNIRGLNTFDKQKEVNKYIEEESLSICVVIETYLKAKSLQRIRDSIFEDWEWISNMKFCDKGCRIMLGWNTNVVNLNEAWVVLGDMNVTLAPNEYSSDISFMTGNMNKFKDCIINIEMKDVASSGLFYTWAKNLFKAKKRAFKFSNFIANKEEFLPLVKLMWEENLRVTGEVVNEELDDEIEMEDISEFVGLDHVGEEDVEIPNIGLNDTFLNKLVDGKYISDKDVGAKLDTNSSSSRNAEVEDSSVDERFKVKEGFSYPVHNPNLPWNEMAPLLGIKFEHPYQLKDCLINYEVANGYQLWYRRNDYRSISVLCGRNVKEGRCTGQKGKQKVVEVMGTPNSKSKQSKSPKGKSKSPKGKSKSPKKSQSPKTPKSPKATPNADVA